MEKDNHFRYLHNTRQKLFIIIFGTETHLGRLFDVVLLYMILTSILLVMLESVQSISSQYEELFYILEWLFTVFFSIEFLLRLWISRKPSNYLFSFFGLVDLMAVIPTYLTLFYTGGSYLIVIRAVRLLRVFRILKLSRQLSESRVLVKALISGRHKILVFLGGVLTLVIIMGTLMYLIEGSENGFDSIPRSIYWAIVTTTTVGYGDIYPVTVLGQILAATLMLMGYAIIAVPTGIISSELNKTSHQKAYKKKVKCSSCGKQKHTPKSKYCSGCGTVLNA
ncbi:ion transporter [Cyclobacteriaceae bacterium]|nr:ion transporter [Cyclobacteriaceae bacterium]MDA8889823.1 ion transporter [Cyclobacteriaceae bacterium]